MGLPAPRPDLPAKLAGGGLVHDIHLPGLRHARVLRPPRLGARLAEVDEAAVQAAAGEPVTLIQDGDFLAILADQESVAERAIHAADGAVTWEGGLLLPDDLGDPASLPDMAAEGDLAGEAPQPASGARVWRAVFTRPYLSHATLGPACAVAHWLGGRLTVWAATQGAYPLRARLARATGLNPRAIVVRPTAGAGCYGDNGADDAAFDAAAIALRAPGRPVRVRWRRGDDFGHEPLGPAMRIALEAELDEAGRPLTWRNETWSGPHFDRGRFLAETTLAATPPSPSGHAEFSGASGALRNAMPPYAMPDAVTIHHRVHPPIRTSSLRSLGAMAQVFAMESFIDELAERAKADPLAYRLALLADDRAQRVLLAAAQMADWSQRGDRGLGLAYARYKGIGAHVAVAAEVEVDERVRLKRLWCVADAGLIVNPEGARQQVEGGALMAASWVLKEAVAFDRNGVASRSWRDYPILRFSEVPPVEVRFVADAGSPPAGLGEAALGPAAAAVANAASRALGVRLRDLPLSRDALIARLAAA
ncbi:MAG: xanthine dehydrogenase family protein molybdopterin-binding subunit [Proteobacteria bacterium]|nr:xanthine dehydrogenase family protein molybdopterin-binding subunit [Pseudomonadota bacterium]